MAKRNELPAKELWRNIQACTPRVLQGQAKFTVQRDMALYWLMIHQVYAHKLDLPRMKKDTDALRKFAPPLACAAQAFLEEETLRHRKLYECYERLANEALRRLNRVFNGDSRLATYRSYVRATALKWLVFRLDTEGGC